MSTDILSLLEKSGIDVRRSGGKDIMALCPFHKDTNPSLAISSRDGVWYCFSCCRGGSLRQLIGSSIKRRDYVPKKKCNDIGMSIEQYYSLPSAEGCKFLLDRGITNETIRKWEIKRSLLSLVIPIKEQGNIIGSISRVLLTDYDPKYRLSSGFEKRKHLFPEINLESDLIILVEGPIDCIKSRQFGYENVYSTLGVSVTKEHVDILKKRAYRAMFLFDNDIAGMNATRKSSRLLMLNGLEVFVPDYRLYKSKDPADMEKTEMDNLVCNKVSYLKSKLRC